MQSRSSYVRAADEGELRGRSVRAAMEFRRSGAPVPVGLALFGIDFALQDMNFQFHAARHGLRAADGVFECGIASICFSD